MGLTDLFSKLIVEHGSAEVQSKHIALFKDQLALADKKISELETENAAVKSKLEYAEATIQKLTTENELLRSKIEKYEQPIKQSCHETRLEEIKERILYWLSRGNLTSKQVSDTLQINIEITKFHLEELKANGMTKTRRSFEGQVFWLLAQEGRRYLISNNLIT